MRRLRRVCLAPYWTLEKTRSRFQPFWAWGSRRTILSGKSEGSTALKLGDLEGTPILHPSPLLGRNVDCVKIWYVAHLSIKNHSGKSLFMISAPVPVPLFSSGKRQKDQLWCPWPGQDSIRDRSRDIRNEGLEGIGYLKANYRCTTNYGTLIEASECTSMA